MSAKALVVDDSRATRKILKGILADAGFEADEAEDGVAALAVLETISCPALALVDWNMPNMNGLELVQAVRKNPAYADMKIMMVTTESEMDNVLKALEAGANEYVMKPFTKETLQDKLRILGLSS